MKLQQVILVVVLLAVTGITLGSVWLAYAEYRFSSRPEVSFDLRARWLGLVMALFFVIAGIGGVVGLYHVAMSRVRHLPLSQWEDLAPKQLAGVCMLGAAAVVCCCLAICQDDGDGERQSQLGRVEPGQVIGTMRTTHGIRLMEVGGRAPTGFAAYWLQAVTCALSVGFTCYVASLLREPVIVRHYY